MDVNRVAVVAGVASLVLVGMAGASAPASAAETCRGVQATILAEGNEGLIGTDGPDVIVARDVIGTVDARGGDDLICAFGEYVSIYGGDGDDVVDTSGVTRHSSVLLGSGDDTYYGGPGRDAVNDASWMTPTVGSDVDEIWTGAGRDVVGSGLWPGANHDRIHLGSGRDSASIQPIEPDGVLDFGTGPASLFFALPDSADDWTIDSGARTLLSEAGVMSWQGDANGFGADSDAATTVRFIGTPGPDSFLVPTNLDDLRLIARMGAGNDAIAVWDRTADGSVYRLGRGHDKLSLGTNGTSGGATQNTTVRVDLAHRHLDYGTDPETAVVGGVEDLVVRGRDVTVTGTAADEKLLVNACRVVVRAGAGDDRVLRGGLALSVCDGTSLLRGGPGRDRLIGHERSNDVIIGGRGFDHALAGWRGNDRCQAEVMHGCEHVIG